MSTIVPELAGIVLVGRKCSGRSRGPQFHMQIMDMEVAGRSFPFHLLRSSLLEEMMGELPCDAVPAYGCPRSEVGLRQGLHLVFQPCL